MGTPSRLLHCCGRVVKKKKKVLARWFGGEAGKKRPGLVGAALRVVGLSAQTLIALGETYTR